MRAGSPFNIRMEKRIKANILTFINGVLIDKQCALLYNKHTEIIFKPVRDIGKI